MPHATKVQRKIDDLVDGGAELERIERQAIEPATALNDDQQAALWLYAWARVSRRGEPLTRTNVVPLHGRDGAATRRGRARPAALLASLFV